MDSALLESPSLALVHHTSYGALLIWSDSKCLHVNGEEGEELWFRYATSPSIEREEISREWYSLAR